MIYGRSKMLLPLTLLILFFAMALTANLCIGEVFVTPDQALSILTGAAAAGGTGTEAVLLNIRLPRLLTAALVGAALSASGYLLQKLSRNELADPYLTGVSSGAALAVAFGMLLAVDFTTLPLLALAGGALSSLLVIVLAKNNSGKLGLSVPKLLLSGIALSSLAAAAVNLLMNLFGNQVMAQGLALWLAGGVSGRTWGELVPASLYIVIALLLALVMAKPLRLLSLGEEAASSLGLNVQASQLAILASAVLLAATAVSLSGLVGFVGLIGPHLARRLFAGSGANLERIELIASALSGATLTLLADLAARTLCGGQELPLGTLMAIVGAPCFIFLLARSVDRLEAR